MYNDIKTYNGEIYSGMTVGRSHHWNYANAVWDETKITPEIWQVKFTSNKRRRTPAPTGSGVPLKSKYHWLLVADQVVEKIDKDSYQTALTGLKYKIGHKRPYWEKFSYNYPGQLSYRQRVIKVLRDTLLNLLEVEAQEGRLDSTLRVLEAVH